MTAGQNQILAAIKALTGKKDLRTFTTEDFQAFNEDARRETPWTHDDENPAFILSGINNDLLGLIAKGKINMKDLANEELFSRGFDSNGKWIAF